ncbi:hypothetical protein ACET3Z_015110 [Daucus carota]
MGRGKIEIKRIENQNNRQVTYSKRRKGLIKKAKEITVLCEAAVSVVIFSSPSKLYEYCSPSTSITEMLDRYHQHSGQRLWDPEHEALSNEIKRIKEENEKMQIDLRHLNAEDITSLNIKELMTIENDLENGLMNIGEKRRESYKRMQKDGQRLEEENMQLRYVYQQQMEAMAGKVRDIENEFNHLKVNDQHVTYSKRRHGLFKKAQEINVLCDAKVSVVVVNSSNKMFEFCSSNTTLANQLQSYQDISRTKLWDAKHEDLSKEIERIDNENKSMQIRLRHLNGEDVTSLHLPELASLEATLDTGLRRVRNWKMEEFDKITQRDQDLEDENKRLRFMLQQQEMGMAVAAMDSNVRDQYQQQMPFSFRVQPNQPNLHERM